MDFVAPILTPVVNSLLVPVKRALSFLVSSSRYVREMHVKEQVLDGAARDMHNQQELNNANSRMVPHRVRGWLKEVQDIKAEITEKIPTGGVIGCCNMKMRYKAGKYSSDIAQHIDRLMKEKAEMVWSDELIPLGMVSPPRSPTSATVHEDVQSQNKNTIDSRDLIFKDVLKSLEPNNTKIQKMALCGMGGIGKTTLLKQLKKAAKDRKMFQRIVYLEVGQNPNITSIQQVVAEQLGEALTETVVYTRADRLQKRFELLSEEGKNKILILLDDVWEKFELEDIGLTSSLPSGFKLLITSRKEDVCTDICGEISAVFEINELEDPEDKKLFWESVGLVLDDIEPDLHHIGEDIVTRCGGLPLALVTIGSNLRNKKIKSEWNNALSRMKNKKFPDVLTTIFMFSYENLREDDLKAIFLLTGLLSEDYNIRIDDLLMYGWGLRFFKDASVLAEARDSVETCINMLIRSNLLIKGDYKGCVKIHDLVRDFVLNNFSEVKQASIVFHDKSVLEHIQEEKSYERILLKCGGMSELPKDFNHPNLSFLKLIGGSKLLKFPEDFSTRMKKLEVFVCDKMYPLLLPQFSTNIRVLFLHMCSLVDDDISFIGDLPNLEVLSLVRCDIKRLPSKIGNLKKLRLLDLTENADLCIDVGVLEKLEKLEELYMAVYDERTSKFTDANYKELNMLSRTLFALEIEFFENKALPIDVSFEYLERFRISVGCILGWSSKTSFINTLQLCISSTELSKCKINELFVKTEMLRLEVNDLSYLEDILVHPPQSSFPNLKELCISGCASLKYLFTVPVAKGLKKLESLKISSCSVLKSVVGGEHDEDKVITFSLLRILHLEELPELVSLCDLINVVELPQLVDLLLDGLPNITSFFPKENTGNIAKLSFLKREDVIPNLKKLTVCDMENLKEIWLCENASGEEEVNKNFMFIRQIKLRNCNSLENLFPSNTMQLLSHLEELEVDYCDSIEVLFDIDLVETEHPICSSSLRRIEVHNCGSFREVWRIKAVETNYFDLLTHVFQAIESISIFSCERFRNIVTPTTLNFHMRALKNIHIWDCGEHDERENGLVKNSQGQEIVTVSKEDTLSQVGVFMSIAALPSHQITLYFHHLCEISLYEFPRVEVVFEIEVPSNRGESVAAQQNPLLLLPHLEHLKVGRTNTLKHVWKCRYWNAFFIYPTHQTQLSSLKNLTTINLSLCGSIKYLFSPLMLKLLSNLKIVEIWSCDGMEEIVSSRDDEDEEMISGHTASTVFPHLDLLKLQFLDNLKCIGGGFAKGTTHGKSKQSHVDVVAWSLSQYSREIDINGCGALTSVIPSYTTGRMEKLQVLSIKDCRSLVEVFETNEINNNSISITDGVPRPTNTTMHKFPNLKILEISCCELLEYAFTFSTVRSLKNLIRLKIVNCKAMKAIVKEEVREGTLTPSKEIVLPRLKSIVLDLLPNFEGFYLGMNAKFQCPLLDNVMIEHCPQMMALTSGSLIAPRLKYIHTKLGKHIIEEVQSTAALHQTPSPSLDGISSRPTSFKGKAYWSFHNLIECNLDSDSFKDTKIFPSSELQQLQKLETVHVGQIYQVEEVFEVASEEKGNESRTVVTFPKLREVNLRSVFDLKYIWKSNPWRTLRFPNLTTLSLVYCGSLEYVFTCSMVGSVMQLQKLHIEQCNNIKVIVKEEEDGDGDCKVKEIIKFPCLKSLNLEHLSSLEGFSLGKEDFAFPALDTFVIKGCEGLMVFTHGCLVAPKLTTVETGLGSYTLIDEDLNSFIRTKKIRGYGFGKDENQCCIM